MSRNDGINRTVVRNQSLTAKQIHNAQRHNEREKEIYTNPDIVPERAAYNIHFKEPSGSYDEMLAQMIDSGSVSIRGLKDDAKLYGELIFDVNSAYFYNHGGYDFARRFYEDAYKAAIQIVGGERYILSAVMHADERNRAMSDALGRDVYHYHMHVVYVPVVVKQILWTKRCKDKSLVGTVKETVMQVSSSKKWASKPVMDRETGEPMRNAKGKIVLRKSYSVLQDDFFRHMREAGYNDLERGERNSSEEHLTVTQFKVMKEQERLDALEQKVEKKQTQLETVKKRISTYKTVAVTISEIEQMGKKKLIGGKIELTADEARELKILAKQGIAAGCEVAMLKQKLGDAKKKTMIYKERLETLIEESRDYLAAKRKAPEKTINAIREILEEKKPEREKKEREVDRKTRMEIG